jgi:steroid delta-isomerase-like uncharacterized protein
MSVQDILRQTIDAFNRHDAEAFAACYAGDAVARDPQYAEPLRGRDAIRKDVADFFAAFPDVHATLDTLLANGDTAASEGRITGTHRGSLVTPAGPVPATNRRVDVPVARVIRVDGQGKIAECRRYFDMAGLAQQLGLE